MVTTESRILVIEGPAGAGKSYLIDKVPDVLSSFKVELPPNIRIDRPRAYEGETGVGLSAVKDVLNLAWGMSVSEKLNGSIGVIDRCVLSQWVYGLIRSSGLPILHEHRLSKILRSTIASASELSSSFWVRDLPVPYPASERRSTKIAFLILLPSQELLIQNREKVGEVFMRSRYPYDFDKEIQCYRAVLKIHRRSSDFVLYSSIDWDHEISTIFHPVSFVSHEELDDNIRRLPSLLSRFFG